MRVPRLSEEEITDALARLPGWERRGNVITRTYAFADFRRALLFVAQVGTQAEDMDHHPDIDIRYRRVTLTLTTHDSRGLTRLDRELAAACDALAAVSEGTGQ